MTNLPHHCTDLETSRKLKEIGVPQNSSFYWIDTRKSWKEYNCSPPQNRYGEPEFVPFYNMDEDDPELLLTQYKEEVKHGYNNAEPMSAYLLSELIEILGPDISDLYLRAGIWTATTIHPVNDQKSESPIQAVANLILKLHEEGILTFNEKEI